MLNLANSINRLNLLVQQTKLTESLQQNSQQSRSKMVAGTPQTVFIGDIPKEVSLVELYELIKESVGDCEVVLKRPALKYFYYAFCRFPDIMQARKLVNEIKYPELHGKVCRALPYDKDLLRNCVPKANVFVKGFSSHWSHKDLHDNFAKYGQIVSARVSIKNDYESRGYGFVQFTQSQPAITACQEMDGKQITCQDGSTFTLLVRDFVQRSERVIDDSADSFNNLYVKNFPTKEYNEEDLRSSFEQFGPLVSVKIDPESKAFGFVAFHSCDDAQSALTHFTKLETEATDASQQLKVFKCMKREHRSHNLKKEHLKTMRDLARNNLYFKGFPCDGQIDDLNGDLRAFFEKFGEVKTLKLPTRMVPTDCGTSQKEQLLGFGFVSFQTLESAQKCRFDVNKELFKSVYKIYANPFEWKELRVAHKMEQVDQKELYRYLQTEHSKKANEVLTSVKDDLKTEQGQLLLRVLTLLTKVQADKDKKKEERYSRSRSREPRTASSEAAPPSEPQAQQSAVMSHTEESQEPAPIPASVQMPAQQNHPLSRQEREWQMVVQAYSVRFQTVITGKDYREGDQDLKKQLLGTFIYDHVKMFLERAFMQHGILIQSPQQDLTPKITGMIMSLRLENLTMTISSYEGLSTKVNEAFALLYRNYAQPPQQSQR